MSVFSKSELRARLSAARRAQPSMDSADLGVRAALVDLAGGMSVASAYVPLPGEPGGPGLPGALAAVCDRLLLPVLLPDLDLDWAVFDGRLAPGPYGLAQPTGARLGVAAISQADLVIVPALAVRRRDGVRLGRGGGSYDRALSRVRPQALIVAALYADEVLDELPAEPHDQRVHAVVTPAGVLRL